MRFPITVLYIAVITATPAFAQSESSPPPSPSQAGSPPAVTPQTDTRGAGKAPEHYSTSWATLAKDAGRDYITFPRRKSTWVILGIGAATALATHLEDDYIHEHITGEPGADKFFSLGQWIGSSYVQMGSAVGLWAIGRYAIAPATGEARTNKYSEIGFDLLRAQFLSQGIVQGMKHVGQRERPTGECCSFPSGHAATAFAAASVLERHLGYRASWPFLAGATYVAASRLVDDRHFLSDVMMGAAVGTAAGWTVVGHQGPNQFTLQPVPVKGGMMLAFVREHHDPVH
jgi:membrane-associated phospholipid phosphatase